MMLRILGHYLENHPDWQATLIGGLPEDPKLIKERLHPAIADRLELTGRLPHAGIAEILSDSRIFLMTSRHESFNIAAAEALCAGCSVVAPPHIASSSWFCGSDSGTVAARYSGNMLLDSLEVEQTAWEEGRRNPMTIAQIWRDRTGASAVARRFVEILSSL